MVAGTDVAHGELHVLGLQFVTDVADQLSGGDRLVGKLPGTGSVAPA